MDSINKNAIGYYAYTRQEMLDFIPLTSRKILEIGCSEGEFGGLVKKRLDAEIWGIELSLKAAEIASGKLDKVIEGDFLEKSDTLPENYFDCVIFNDVLEHFPDPWLVLEKVKKVLTERGSVVASIPNVRYIGNLYELLVKKDWEYKAGGGILDITHYRFFTQKSIRRLFESSDFKVQRIEGINSTPSWKVKLLSFLTAGHFSDAKYLQFAVVAILK